MVGTWNTGRRWIAFVLVLCLPALLYVPLHLLDASGRLPNFPGLPVSWAVALTAMFGAPITIGAVAVAIALRLNHQRKRAELQDIERRIDKLEQTYRECEQSIDDIPDDQPGRMGLVSAYVKAQAEASESIKKLGPRLSELRDESMTETRPIR